MASTWLVGFAKNDTRKHNQLYGLPQWWKLSRNNFKKQRMNWPKQVLRIS